MDVDPVLCDFEVAEIMPRAYNPIRFSARPVGAFGAKGPRLILDFKPAELEKMMANKEEKKA